MPEARLHFFSGVVHIGGNLNEQEFKEWRNELHPFLVEMCKTVQYQLERGDDNGNLHYQVMCETYSAYESYPDDWVLEHKAYWQPMTNNERKIYNRGKSYAMKQHSRVDGPWANPLTGDMRQMLVDARRLDRLPELYERQQQIIANLDMDESDRTFNVLFDTEGGWGKNKMFQYLVVKTGAIMLVATNDEKSLGYKCLKKVKKAEEKDPQSRLHIIINIPRGVKEVSLPHIMSFVESLKDGEVVSDKYESEDYGLVIEPRVTIGTNFSEAQITAACISKDRPIFYDLNSDYPRDYSELDSELS